MKSKTFYVLIGLVIGVTMFLVIGANNKRHCVCNPAGCHWVSGLAKGQTPVADSFCPGDDKQDPTPTDGPRLPTERPTATREIENTPTPGSKIIITDPPHNPTATATRRIDPTATATRRIGPTATTTRRATHTATPTGEWTGPKVDQDLPDPTATPCPNCVSCPDMRCSLATIAAAQATQANWITNP